MNCAHCNSRITGEMTSSAGRTYHPSCAEQRRIKDAEHAFVSGAGKRVAMGKTTMVQVFRSEHNRILTVQSRLQDRASHKVSIAETMSEIMDGYEAFKKAKETKS